mmetsp:Transcript_13704/g.54228  ORF Transcript_13704/g.54228 Transcript_13704/m.54228 type:complete len:262 (+) Transcript_13704:554-1339(+)
MVRAGEVLHTARAVELEVPAEVGGAAALQARGRHDLHASGAGARPLWIGHKDRGVKEAVQALARVAVGDDGDVLEARVLLKQLCDVDFDRLARAIGVGSYDKVARVLHARQRQVLVAAVGEHAALLVTEQGADVEVHVPARVRLLAPGDAHEQLVQPLALLRQLLEADALLPPEGGAGVAGDGRRHAAAQGVVQVRRQLHGRRGGGAGRRLRLLGLHLLTERLLEQGHVGAHRLARERGSHSALALLDVHEAALVLVRPSR